MCYYWCFIAVCMTGQKCDGCLCAQRDLDFIIEVNFNGQLSSKMDLMRYKMR